MDKNTYYETVKNMAVEKVLNQYCSDSDPSRPALKKLLEDLLDWFMLSERQIYLLKNENDKGNGLDTSPVKGMHFPASPFRDSARDASLSALLATATTFAPSFTKSSTIALPIPEEAPVTTIALSLSFIIYTSFAFMLFISTVCLFY
jgi:hypothetical protein